MWIRRSSERGHADHGWLQSQHTFSFARYFDPRYMGFSDLRVINEDRVEPGRGFGRHPHRDMEIISYVLDGALEHRDSMGNGSIIRRDDVQLMSAGTGVTHSEFNHSQHEPVHFLQIWIQPADQSTTPRYEQKRFERLPGELQLLASPDGRGDSLRLGQDASLHRAILGPTQSLALVHRPSRLGWLHVVRGQLRMAQQELTAGDAVAFERGDPASRLETQDHDAEILFFDLP